MKINICWFRRDLRLHDNAALYQALRDGIPVLPLFIFDRTILDKLEDKADKRVEYIYHALTEMQKELLRYGSSMEVAYGVPEEIFRNLLRRHEVQKIYTNDDYEPYAVVRDAAIETLAGKAGVGFVRCKDHVIFEKSEVVKENGEPYTVFTPYSRKWKALLTEDYLKPYPAEKYFSHLLKRPPLRIISLSEMGFEETHPTFAPPALTPETLRRYKLYRDFPGITGTTRMSLHLRFGTVSIRDLAGKARALSESYLNELIWRDFYQMILWNFPHVGDGRAFRREYERIQWRNNEKEFERWCNGETGYPIVDAGMRELNQTGYMHNRVRMIVASFLTKHLLIDWRWGEAYFAQKLLDFDLAANNGGWQWAAGSGCDAAPYFRIFNPYLQTRKFDPQLRYIRQWVPEFERFDYPRPIVDHAFARQRCLEAYGKVLRMDNR